MFQIKRKQTTVTDFEKIVDEYSDLLFRQAFYRLGSASEAQDVVQEVFISYYKSNKRNTEIANLKSYLLQSVYNACNNWRSRKRKETIPIEGVFLIDDFDTSGRTINREKIELTYKLLKQLPHEQAEVVQLKLMEELKFSEISRILKLPEPTVKSRFRYGLDKLKSIIQTKNYYNELF